MNLLHAKRLLATAFTTVSVLLVTANAQAADGKAVYESTCVMCHKTGVMGAPKFGEGADWKDRIAQGNDVLYDHALNGFQGKKGKMPAKGGKPNLADDDVKAAVDYMVSNAK